MKYIDLTHTFTPDMPVYPGDPKATLEQVAEISKDTYNDHKISTVMHVGTHMDAPLHMIEDGKRIDELKIENFFGRGVVIDVRGKMSIDASVIGNIQIDKGSIVLLYTGFGNKYRTDDYFKNYPEVKEDFANKMAELGVKSVGMDMLGPDYDKPWLTHKALLAKDITILENLTNLDQLLNVDDFNIIALPVKFQSDAAPVRVIAVIQ
ncbi:MAG TPA: cyclase family protein [Methylomirabilota bacterium]|nr:cyclase family protein [Methylomirabilota bacterium]